MAVREYQALIVDTARKYGLRPSLVAAQIQQESGGNPLIVSGANCVGLMQVGSNKLFPDRPTEEQLKDPAFNVDWGCRYLKGLLDKWTTQGSALAAYFGAIDGEGRITEDVDVTGANGWDYVRSVESKIPSYVDLDLWAPAEIRAKGWGNSWPEILTNVKGVADDALARLRMIRAYTDDKAGTL